MSNDNDMIFLLLPFLDDDISIIQYEKNETTQNVEYMIINLKNVRKHFLNKIPQNYMTKAKFEIQNVINDFVGLSFFLGNDYINMFDEIANCYQPFDAIIETYVNLNLKGSRYIYLTYRGSFDKQILKRFVLNLSTNIKKKTKIKYQFIYQNSGRCSTKYDKCTKLELFILFIWNDII